MGFYTSCNKIQLYTEELHHSSSPPNIIRVITSRRMRWVGHMAGMWEKRNTCGVLARISEGKRPFGRPKHRADDNIGMNLKEVG
jgi:hypothetical protein